MKKYLPALLLLILIPGAILAQSTVPQTPNLKLYLPQEGNQSAWLYDNYNWGIIDGFGVPQPSLGIVTATSYSGADIGAQANAAYTAAGTGGTVNIPVGSYSFSTSIVFAGPGKLQCEPGTVLNYTGSGTMLQMGLTNLSSADYGNYEINGCEFTGGASMTNGIYFSSYVVYPRLRNSIFKNFGNSTAYAVFFQSNNWDIEATGNSVENTDGAVRNFMRVRGKSTGGVTDFGNSRLRFVNNHMTSPAGVSGVGVWVTGTDSDISHNKIEGFNPNVLVAPVATYTTLTHDYFEDTAATGGCVEYGDPAGGDSPSAYVVGLHAEDIYCNAHNTDSYGTSDYFLYPSTNQAGIQNSDIKDIRMASYTSGRELVYQNNLYSQLSNDARLIQGATVLHTTGGNITAWGGDAGESWTVGGFMDAAGYVHIKAGVTADQYKGLCLTSKAGVDQVCFQASGNGFANITTGMEIGSSTYASLGTPAIGIIEFCTDCKNSVDDSVAVGSVATSGGHGAYVDRVNSTWRTMN